MTGDTAFWVPGKAGESKIVLDKPEMTTLCPATGDKLKLKVGLSSWLAAPLYHTCFWILRLATQVGRPPANSIDCFSLIRNST